jgi:putative membrane-bound dehydrogenase-like protein
MKLSRLLFALILGLSLALSPAVRAQKKTQSVRIKLYTPEEELAGFKVPPGFVVELVASEKDGIVNPIDLTFDDAGRLWTQTATMYPLDPVADIQWNDLLKLMDDPEAQKNHPAFKRILDLYQGKTKGTDKVLILSDLYGKTPAKVNVWADGLTIPMSILPYKGGAYVAQGAELFFLADRDQDGKADTREPLLTGFGFTDTHTMAHALVRGPGDWIHFSHGALNKGEVASLKSDAKQKIDFCKIARFSLDATRIGLVNNGLNNIWGFQLRGNGQWYGSEANDLGFSVVPMEPQSGYPGIGNDRLRPYQPFVSPLHEFRVGGTGISGTAFADDASGSFPEDYRNVAFLANPITSTINAVRVVRNVDGTVTAEHLPDLLTSDDDWFRPVNMEFGPDGCLYVADWYNKIVSHNELPTTHPDRDKSHGRIWRIRHVSQQPRPIPDLTAVSTSSLVQYLRSPSIWEKRAAWHQITDRPREQTQPLTAQLFALAADKSEDENTRIHALWSLEGIKAYNAPLITSLLQSAPPDLKREAIRSLTSFSISSAERAALLKPLMEEANPMIRSQVLRTLAEAGTANHDVIDILVRACKFELPGNGLGGAYERKFERFLARMALEQYADELHTYLQAPLAVDIPVLNMLWATQALPTKQREDTFLTFWPQSGISLMDESTFISIASMLGNPRILEAVKSNVEAPAHAKAYVSYSLQNQSQVQSAELARLLEAPVKTLMKSKAEIDQNLALDAIGRYKIKNVQIEVVASLSGEVANKTLDLALKALETDSKQGQEVLLSVIQNPNLSFGTRAVSVSNLTRVNPKEAQAVLLRLLPKLSPNEKTELTKVLSSSKEGAGLLVDSYAKKQLGLSNFDMSSAERVVASTQGDSRGKMILDGVKKREEEKKKAFDEKLSRYMIIAGKHSGNPKEGKLLFQTCLLCHQVGTEGQNIAPALDGSASRENEALITAILDPDAAVESGYAVYRVTKKDGSSVEGYLVNKEARGTTVAFMGGSKVFVEAGAIKSQGFLGGRSFMPKGLIDQYKDKQVADLLSFIKTLK